MKRLVFLVLFVGAYAWAKPIDWQKNFEIILGFYDVGVTTSARIFELDYLSWQVVALRWNPFVHVLNVETGLRYFPMEHFGLRAWVFSSEGINPYLFLNVKAPHTFQALGMPVGMGLVHEWTNFALHFRLYGDLGVVPVFVAGWTFELGASFRW